MAIRTSQGGRLKRFGVAGALFFTLKGLLWVAIPLLMARGCVD